MVNIKQYYLGCLSHASYMVSDEKTKTAVVIDPQRDVDQYVKDAKDQGLTIKDVVLTHFHADFVAGHLELAKRTGAQIHLGAEAQPSYPFTPHQDGDSIPVGEGRLQVLATPGHTPEAISLVAYAGAEPKAVFTGDTLFVGDVGRPDLAVATGHSSQDLAGQLYDSLHGKLLTLPDATVVYPAHGPGSLCGSGGTSGKSSTVGREKAENPMLSTASKEAFVEAVTANLPEVPAYFSHDAEMNKEDHATLETIIQRSSVPLKANDFIRAGAQVLDVRSPDEFAAAHLTDSVNVGLDGRFAQWAGSLLDPNRPMVVIAPPGRETETITRLARVGFENVIGYAEGGFEALGGYPNLIREQPRMTAPELAERRDEFNVLDVRSDAEWKTGHLAGAQHIPLGQLKAKLDDLPSDKPLLVHCQSGYRSSMATSLLKAYGIASVDMVGGIAAWTAAGLPTTPNP